jgi:aryl-alcohol dehydrogenase-like predicted oxidoreductase
MNLSHAYGIPPSVSEAEKVISEAIELGVTHFDTAALYGFGRNEELVGKALRPVRDKVILASKGGLQGVDGKRTLDGRPETLRKSLEDSLRRLQTDVIDLYYLHRWDKTVPVEDSIGELAKMVEEGKVRAIGLSEVSAGTLRKAHAVHPVAAVQTEYSLWTRNAEIAVIDACSELGAAFVAFSPLARGFLADINLDPQKFPEKDIRRNMPRFKEPSFSRNKSLLEEFSRLAAEAECSPVQLALAWILAQAPHIHVIPGTTSTTHLRENVATSKIRFEPEILSRAGSLINRSTISGPRYPSATQAEIDTEEF